MRRVIAAINITLDGICDHTSIDPDEELHKHYADLLREGDIVLYGRITYQLMEYWKSVVANPTGDKGMDDFAIVMDKIPKLVFSNTLKDEDLGWNSAKLAKKNIEEEIADLKKQPGKDIMVGSRSLIIQLLKLNLIDEFQLCIHPVIAGGGLPLFENMKERTVFKLAGNKVFRSGAIILYYESTNA